MACLPFCNTARLSPSPMFWGEWVAVGLFALWLALARALAPSAPRVLTWSAVAVLALVALIFGQQLLGMAAQPIALLLSAGLLALAAALVAAGASIDDPKRRAALARAFAWGVLAALALNAVVVVLGWAGYEPLFFDIYPAPVLPRAVGLIGQANHLGALAVLGLSAAFFLHATRRLPLSGLWGAVIAVAVVVTSTSSRVAWLQGMVALALTAWWGRRRDLATGLRPVNLVAIAVFFIAAQAGWLALSARLAPAAIDNAAVFTRNADAGRTEMLRDAYAMWLKHPVLGVGHGNYAAARLHELDTPMRHANVDHAHNLFAQAMAEWGTLGLAIIVALVCGLLLVVWRRARDPLAGPEELMAATWLLCLLTHSQLEHPLWFMHFLLPLALLVGLLRQPVVWRRPAPAPRRPAVTAALAMLVVSLAAVSAWDYWRIQNLALMFRAEVDRPVGTPNALKLSDVAAVELLTLFPRYPRIMLSMMLPMDDGPAEPKLDIARQAMDLIPSGESVARYALFAVLAGQGDEARLLVQAFAHRIPSEYDLAYGWMKRWSAGNPKLERFVMSLPVGKALDTLLVQPRR
jgi:O-antigen ligase